VVFVYLSWIVPVPSVPHTTRVNLINLGLFLATAAVGFPLGYRAGVRRSAAIRDWLVSDRAPTPEERDKVLRMPLEQARFLATLWAAAALIFFAVNVWFDVGLAFEVAVTILLGGVVTSALGYLLLERINRETTERALAIGPPRRPAGPGVRARLLLSWAIGTAVFMLAIAALTVAVLIDPSVTTLRRVSASVLFLSVGGIGVGLLTMAVAARSVADPLESVRSALAEVERGEIDVEVPVEDGSEVGLLQAGVNRMVAGLREHERLRDLFGRHVGEDVARNALERGVELGGEVRPAAVLFVDVIGSTTLAAERPPDEVVSMLNAFFGVVVEVVRAHGGWVNKFEGDAALCVFGAPLELEDAAGCALAAARAMRDRLRDEVGDLPAGIGVSAGDVVAGNVGAAERFEYTVIGDPVNEAARLTELAKQRDGHLLASEAVVRRATGEEAERWSLDGSVELRGRPEPTRVATA
jgi:adenylate cyclase